MKKVGLLIVGGIAGLVLIGNSGPLIGLAISLVIMYYAFKGFMKAPSFIKKVLWTILGVFAFLSVASNFPAIVALVSAFVLYHVIKKWKEEDEVLTQDEVDPFTNFEKQWAELHKNY